jgi:hypothetical protein
MFHTAGPAMGSSLCSTGSRPSALGLGAFQHPSGMDWPSIVQGPAGGSYKVCFPQQFRPVTDGWDGRIPLEVC